MRVLRGAPGINFGAQGSTGATGPEGPMGPTGPAGPQGIPGGVGNTGLTGPSGPTGPAGPQGIAGSQGPQGYVGETGPEGPAGPQGAVGPRGLTGTKGIQGDVGATGATGPPGPPGPSSVISAPSHYRVLSLVDVTQALNFRNFFSSTAIDGSRLLVFSTDPVARPTGNHEVVRCFARVSIRDNNGGNWVMRPAVLDMPGTSTTYVPQVIVEVPAFDTPSLGVFAANNIVVQAWWYFFVY